MAAVYSTTMRQYSFEDGFLMFLMFLLYEIAVCRLPFAESITCHDIRDVSANEMKTLRKNSLLTSKVGNF
jgi:hypothetical protein